MIENSIRDDRREKAEHLGDVYNHNVSKDGQAKPLSQWRKEFASNELQKKVDAVAVDFLTDEENVEHIHGTATTCAIITLLLSL